MDKAIVMARKAIEGTYNGLCAISNYENIKNPKTFETELKEVEYYTDVKCKLSQVNLTTIKQTESIGNIVYDAKLFLAPEINIKSGSKIQIKQNGMGYVFEYAGEPFKYMTHQEIMLKRVDRV